MTRKQSNLILSAIILGLASGSASADFLFSFSGTISSDNGTTALDGSAFTLNMFVQDVAIDLTSGANMGTYRISSAQMDIGSDSIIEESFTPNQLADQAVYIDAGSTQLVGAFDLAGSFATFLFGINMPSNAFADPHSLAGQSSFSLTGLDSSSFSFYRSNDLNLILNLDAFTFDNNVNVVPLPPAGTLALGLLVGLGITRRVSR
jgi:hypothetical protein